MVDGEFQIIMEFKAVPKAQTTVTITTRACFSQPHKFETLKIDINEDCTLGDFRRKVAMELHGVTNVDADILMTHPLKCGDLVVKEELNTMILKSWMQITNREELHFNMTVDGYGEGGGKRGVSLTNPH